METIEKSMIAVINSWNGTAHNLYKEGGLRIAGKTGTAQIRSLVDQELTVKEEYEGIREICSINFIAIGAAIELPDSPFSTITTTVKFGLGNGPLLIGACK